MKTNKLSVLLLAAAVMLALCVFSAAGAETDGNWRYIELDDETCLITNYTADERDIVVPESFNGRPVSGIGTGVFYNKSVETVQLPPSLTLLDNNAFQDAHSLREVRPYPGKSLNIRTIGWYAFYKTALSDLSGILRNVTYMDDNVFYGCENLTSVTLPDCLQGIGSCDFKMCTNLKKVSLPKNSQFTKLPAHTFYGCTSLKSLTIPGNVTTIGDKCFYRSGITSFTIPQSVTSVGVECFAQCDSLKKVVFQSKDCDIKRDIITGSPQAKIYSYQGGTVEKYTKKYNCAFVSLHTVSFNAGGGSGKMAKETVAEDEPFTLPKCGFTAPAGKVFDQWDKGAPGTKITVTADTVLTALWKDAPEGEQVTLKKLKSVKLKAVSAKKLEISWKKLSKKEQKKIQKIEIQYSTDKTFQTDVKTKWAKKGKASYTIKGLKKNTKYWVRIRAWKKDGNIIYVSKWVTKGKKTKKK